MSSPSVIEPLSLPPPGIFESKEAVYNHIQGHAKQAGYVFVIGKGRQRNGRSILDYCCNQGGRSPGLLSTKPGTGATKRQRSTRKIGCQFSVRVREKADGTWSIAHQQNPVHSTHNHDAKPASIFYQHRQLSHEQRELVASNYAAKISSEDTRQMILEQDPSSMVTTKDIQNMNSELNRQKRKALPPPETAASPDPAFPLPVGGAEAWADLGRWGFSPRISSGLVPNI